MVDGCKKKDAEEVDDTDTKTFDWKKKDSASSKKPWREMAETEEEMEEEN